MYKNDTKRELEEPCSALMSLEKIDTPTLISTPRTLLVIHKDGNITNLDFSDISRDKRQGLFDEFGIKARDVT